MSDDKKNKDPPGVAWDSPGQSEDRNWRQQILRQAAMPLPLAVGRETAGSMRVTPPLGANGLVLQLHFLASSTSWFSVIFSANVATTRRWRTCAMQEVPLCPVRLTSPQMSWSQQRMIVSKRQRLWRWREFDPKCGIQGVQCATKCDGGLPWQTF